MPLDWGAKRNHGPNVAARMPLGPKVVELMAEYAPQIIVVRQPNTQQSRESLDDIISHARNHHKIRIKILSLEEVKQAFPGHNNNKDQIASVIAEQVPELLSILPPRRRIWQSEDYRMTVFDAAAAGIAYFCNKTAKIPVPS